MEKNIKKIVFATAVILAVATPSFAQAKCFADYKAKRQTEAGLKLHYGVMQLPGGACDKPAKAYEVAAKRLAKKGWTLLRIISIFDRSGLSQRQNNAGAYFLKY